MIYVSNVRGVLSCDVVKRGKLVVAINGTEQDVQKVNDAIKNFYQTGGKTPMLVRYLMEVQK